MLSIFANGLIVPRSVTSRLLCKLYLLQMEAAMPAIDRYPTKPQHQVDDNLFVRKNRDRIEGPDPFSLVANELQSLSTYVKSLVQNENPVLTMAASHFFDQVIFISDLKAFLLCYSNAFAIIFSNKAKSFGPL